MFLMLLEGLLILIFARQIFFISQGGPLLFRSKTNTYFSCSMRRMLIYCTLWDGSLLFIFRKTDAYLFYFVIWTPIFMLLKWMLIYFILQRGCLLCLFLVFLEAGAYLLLFAKQTLISYAIRHIFIYYTPRDGSSLHFARRIFISFARWVPSILQKAANVCPSLRVPCRASLPSWRSGSCILYIYL